MPEWRQVLKPRQVDAVAVYVKSLAGTNPPNAKAAEGVKIAP
jgi:cytochrome c oxidase cbb3-type subunit 3